MKYRNETELKLIEFRQDLHNQAIYDNQKLLIINFLMNGFILAWLIFGWGI